MALGVEGPSRREGDVIERTGHGTDHIVVQRHAGIGRRAGAPKPSTSAPVIPNAASVLATFCFMVLSTFVVSSCFVLRCNGPRP